MVRKQSFVPRTGTRKRLIRKRIVHGNDSLLIAGVSQALDSITEEETLVRIVGNIQYASLLANPGVVVTEIKITPNASDISPTIIAADAKDGTDAKVVLYGHRFSNSEDIAGADVRMIEVDVKGMRKLHEGDVIVMTSDTDVDNGYLINWYLTLFYKKA